MSQKIGLFVVLMAIWLLLTWYGDRYQVLVGAVLSVSLAWFLSRLYQSGSWEVFRPTRWIWFIIYVAYFLYFCIKANLDVAYRVLNVDLPIRPAIVKVHTRLKSDVAKTFLANSITLTPGTLTIDIKDSDLYIHWINVVTDDPEKQTDIIVRRFENILRRIFE